MKKYILLALYALSAHAQTPDYGRSFRGVVDANLASRTRPFRQVSSAPTTGCSSTNAGEFVTLSPSFDLYRCNGTSWSLYSSGGGGASSVAQLTDMQVTNSGATATIAAGVARVGAVTTAYAGGSVTVSAGTASPGLWIGWNPSANRVAVGVASAVTASCTGSDCFPGSTGFDPAWIPIATCPVSSGTVSACTSLRSVVGADKFVAGTGVLLPSPNANGTQPIQIDTAEVPRYLSGTGVPAMACSVGQFYVRTTGTPSLYICTTTNTWTLAGGGGVGVKSQYFGATVGGITYGPGFAAGDVGPSTATLGGTGHRFTTIQFSGTADNDVSFSFPIPADYTSGLKLTLHWHGNTSGVVRWATSTVCEGSTVNSSDPVTPGNTVAVNTTLSGAAWQLRLTDFTQTATCAAGNFARVNIKSLGADGADTNSDARYLLGVTVSWQ